MSIEVGFSVLDVVIEAVVADTGGELVGGALVVVAIVVSNLEWDMVAELVNDGVKGYISDRVHILEVLPDGLFFTSCHSIHNVVTHFVYGEFLMFLALFCMGELVCQMNAVVLL